MNNASSISATGLSMNVMQFKADALRAMLATDLSANPFASPQNTSGLFDTLLTAAKHGAPAELATPTTPTALDTAQAFSKPGQNVMTVINRVEVTFQAQFSELSALKQTLASEQEVAQRLSAITADTPDADIKSALQVFIQSYNAGVNRFAPDVAQGGVLQGSPEAIRARFATQRDINNPLLGADGGLRGGMQALGITIDAGTGLARLDEKQLDTTLAREKQADVRTIADFADNFTATIQNLNAAGNPQDRQLANLDRAIHWIDDNRSAVQEEFGPGKAATPTAAFARAVAAYRLMSSQASASA